MQEVKASNQQAQFLGNKVEMAITSAVENNKSLLRVGLHFEFSDCRYVGDKNIDIYDAFTGVINSA